MARLEGKVALVSGAARGIGAEVVRRFAREGAAVLFGDINDAAGGELERSVARAGGKAKYLHLDVTSENDWRGAVQQAVDRFGRLDILVNNAGIVPSVVPIEERSADEWDLVMAVNAKGVFLGTKHAIPAMRRVGGGAIVNISSVAGIGQSQIMEAAYAASKGAVRIFTKVTAAQQAKNRIRCNSVHPGPIDTEMLRGVATTPEILERRLTRIPLGRLGRIDEVVAAVLFLASDEASYTTGTELLVDGGALAQ